MTVAAVVTYTRLDGVAGEYFTCPRYRALLATTACAGMFVAAARAPEPKHPACRGCALGALHAGVALPLGAALFGKLMCCRCGRPSRRLLYGALCISCTNRQLEVIRGRNAKGRPPVHGPQLARHVCRVVTPARVQTVAFERATSLLEAVYRVLRASPGTVAFARVPRPPPRRKQGSLFEFPPPVVLSHR